MRLNAETELFIERADSNFAELEKTKLSGNFQIVTIADIGIKTAFDWQIKRFGKKLLGTEALKQAKKLGAKPIEGYQLRYIYFLNEEAKHRLTVPIIPFQKIEQLGAKMYRGVRVTKAPSEYPSDSGGAVPTHTLHL